MLHVVQGKGQKDRYVPLSEHLIRGLKTFISVENPVQYLFNGNQNRNIEEIDQVSSNRPDFDSRYSQKEAFSGSLKRLVKKQESLKMFTPTLCDTALPRICWKMAFPLLWFRNFWVMKE